ncbi:hypothetical protein D3C86_1281740 [compost metagenome]
MGEEGAQAEGGDGDHRKAAERRAGDLDEGGDARQQHAVAQGGPRLDGALGARAAHGLRVGAARRVGIEGLGLKALDHQLHGLGAHRRGLDQLGLAGAGAAQVQVALELDAVGAVLVLDAVEANRQLAAAAVSHGFDLGVLVAGSHGSSSPVGASGPF